MRILAIDLGEKRVGVALSDPLGFSAQGLPTIVFQNAQQLTGEIGKICKEYGVEEVVVGLPKNMDGSMGPMASKAQAYAATLTKALGLPVRTYDERLSSREAQRLMIEQGLSRQKQRANSDRLAATLILQSYLETKRSS